MRVFFEEVMFDLPGVVKAQTVCQLHLLQRFLKQLLLGAICPRAWQLMLIENTKLHSASFDWSLTLCTKLMQRQRGAQALVKERQRGVPHCDRRCLQRHHEAAGPTSYAHTASRQPGRPSARW